MSDLQKTLQLYFGKSVQLTESSFVFWINAFIPKETTNWRTIPGGPYQGKTMMLGPVPWSGCFLTDNREFLANPSASIRLQSLLFIENQESEYKWWEHHRVDETVELHEKTGAVQCSKKASNSRMSFKLLDARAEGLTFSLSSSACNPCVEGAPDISFHADSIDINFHSRALKFYGRVTGYPSFEAYCKNKNTVEIFKHHHKPGATPWTLFAGANQYINRLVIF